MSVDQDRDLKPPASPTCYADEFAELDIHVDVVQVERRTLAAVRKRATAHGLPDAITDALDRVYAYLENANVWPSGSNVVVYVDDELTIEAGVEVSEEFATDPHSTIVCTATPAGTAAHATWFGEYNELAKAHTAVRRWCERHGRTIGLCWERYGDWADDPRQRRTDVYYLLDVAHQGPGP